MNSHLQTSFVSPILRELPLRLRASGKAICSQRLRQLKWSMSNEKKPGFLSKLRQGILKPIVAVPGSQGQGDVIDCVFCRGSGFQECSGCKGTGKDSLGTCYMCNGKASVKCTVCCGVGAVDRVRRGGTDDKNQYVVKNK